MVGLMAVRFRLGFKVVVVVAVVVMVLVSLKGHSAHHNRGILGLEVCRPRMGEDVGEAVVGEGRW